MTENVEKNSCETPHSVATPAVSPAVTSTCSHNDRRKDVDPRIFPISPAHNRFAPLSGKNIFMHYDPGTVANKQTERILQKLKGNITEFFSRDVHYVITNRSSYRASQISPTPRSLPHSRSQVSPLTSKPTLGQSPLGLRPPNPPSSKLVSGAVSRGRAMLMAARKASLTTPPNSRSPGTIGPSAVLRQLQSGESPRLQSKTVVTAPETPEDAATALPSTDLLARAKKLGIRILTIDAVLKWIENLPPDVRAYVESIEPMDSDVARDSPEDPELDRLHQVRHLTPPCVKVIDLSGSWRPLYMDRTDYLPNLWNWPSTLGQKPKMGTHTTSSLAPSAGGASPGLGPHPGLSRSHTATPLTGTFPVSLLSRQTSRKKHEAFRKQQRRKTMGAPTLQRSASVSGKPSGAKAHSKAPTEEEPSGYCECCSVAFTNLIEHLNCVDHKQFASNKENYRILDDVLSRLPSLEEFVSAEAKKYRVPQSGDLPKRRQRSGQNSGDKAEAARPVEKIENANASPPIRSHPDQNTNLLQDNVTEESHVLSPPRLLFPEVKSTQPAKVQLFSDDECVDLDDERLAIPLLTQNPPAEVDLEALPQTLAENTLPDAPSEQAADIAPPSANIPSTTVAPRSVPCHMPLPCTAPFTHDQVLVSEAFRLSHRPTGMMKEETSPILERYHSMCEVCRRVHIPTFLSPSLHLQLSTLLGPSRGLDGFGCAGQCFLDDADPNFVSPSPEKADVADESVLAPTITECCTRSPVFEQGDSDPHPHQKSLVQQQMETVSTRRANLQLPESTAVRTSTPHKEADSDSLDVSACDDEDDFFFSGSPDVHSDGLPNRRSLTWIFNAVSFDGHVPVQGKPLLSPTTLEKLRTPISVSISGGTSGRHFPKTTNNVVSVENTYQDNLELDQAENPAEELCAEEPCPPSLITQTPGRASRVAAKVARESISLSIRALYSPTAMDRFPRVTADSEHIPTSGSPSVKTDGSPIRSKLRPRRAKVRRTCLFPPSPTHPDH